MEFAENNRISHRQLYRQIILTFLAPLLICLFPNRENIGMEAIAGLAGAVILLILYVILLFRLVPCYENMQKIAGKTLTVLISLFFLSYVVLTGAYILNISGQIVNRSLLTDVHQLWITFAAVLVCSMGVHKGMQKRGRMAEVSGGILLWGMILMLILCISQGNGTYLKEMIRGSSLTLGGIGGNMYGFLCAFSGVSLLPFVLEYVEKKASAGRTVIFSILTMGMLLFILQLIFPSVLGWQRLLWEEYPILPLLSGADLPGNVLARFDILWLGFLLYSMLFAVGSLLHYGSQILKKTEAGNGRIWLAALVWALSFLEYRGYTIKDLYSYYLSYIFLPLTILLQLFLLWISNGKKRKKLMAAVSVICLLCLSGCGGVEPENRMYPLALGVDLEEDRIIFTYGMADLSKATGQEKPEETKGQGVVTLEGDSFEAIQKAYDQTQEKYLDLGHLQVMILGKNLLESEVRRELLAYLKENPFVGENIYIFQGESAKEILNWEGAKDCSVGEYLLKMLENRTDDYEKIIPTLRDFYYEEYRSGGKPSLLEIKIVEKQLHVSKP